MKKILLLFITFYILSCEAGPAGPEGIANIHTEIIKLTSSNTQFIQYEGSLLGSQDGYLFYEHNSPEISQAVIDSGIVIVEISPTNNPYAWSSLPYILYDGDEGGINYIYNAEHIYTSGNVGIAWFCSFERSSNDWANIESLWGVYYKISVFNPN